LPFIILLISYLLFYHFTHHFIYLLSIIYHLLIIIYYFIILYIGILGVIFGVVSVCVALVVFVVFLGCLVRAGCAVSLAWVCVSPESSSLFFLRGFVECASELPSERAAVAHAVTMLM